MFVDKNYEASIKELTWHLAKNILLEQCAVKIDDADVKAVAKEMTRMQFAQYGMTNIPEEYLDNYAEEMLKKPEQADQFVSQAADRKLMPYTETHAPAIHRALQTIRRPHCAGRRKQPGGH